LFRIVIIQDCVRDAASSYGESISSLIDVDAYILVLLPLFSQREREEMMLLLGIMLMSGRQGR
jgi:hypothetical protein